MSTCAKFVIPMALIGLLPAVPAAAETTFFNTGNPDGRMATATRPDSAGGKFEIESADDFILGTKTSITGATFTGLLTDRAPLSSVGEMRVEIYRVFPNDSNVGRTSGTGTSPPFQTPNVPTRQNSPSDVEFTDRDTASGNLNFTMTDLGAFNALNTVDPGGIDPKPGQTTGGDGKIAGEEVQFNVTFSDPLILPADHYFFVPQVEVKDAAISFGCRRRDRSTAAPGLSLGICRSDPRCHARPGLAACRHGHPGRRDTPDLQRGVLTVGLRRSRAFELGDDRAGLCGRWLCRLSQIWAQPDGSFRRVIAQAVTSRETAVRRSFRLSKAQAEGSLRVAF
jgi:hypothetical protein